MRFRSSLGLCLLIVFAAGAPADADETFVSPLVADFEFMILADGPLGNVGFPTGVFIPFQALGSLQFGLDDAVNDPNATSADFLFATGTLSGVEPQPFLPYTISPYEFVGGSLNNIVRDRVGNIISGDVVDLSMKWEMLAAPGGNPIRLYTQEGLLFNGPTGAIPFSVGTVLSGAAEFEVYLDEDPDGKGDQVAVIGRNRTLTVVIPEPGASVIIVTAFGLVVGLGRRRSLKL